MISTVAALAGIPGLGLFLSAMGIFSLVSVTVSRRTREIGLRAALGARPRDVLAGILSRALVLIGSGITAGGVLLLLFVALVHERRGALRRVSCGDVRGDARRVSARLHRARQTRAQDQSNRRPEGGLNRGGELPAENG